MYSYVIGHWRRSAHIWVTLGMNFGQFLWSNKLSSRNILHNTQKNFHIQWKLSYNVPIYAAELIAINSAISWLFTNAALTPKWLYLQTVYKPCLELNHTSKSHPIIIYNLLQIINQKTYLKKLHNTQKNFHIQWKLSYNIPIYAAELIAINSAIPWLFINAALTSKWLYLQTVCKPCLELNHTSKSHPIIIYNLLQIINQKHIKKIIVMEICLIFAHVGVASN